MAGSTEEFLELLVSGGYRVSRTVSCIYTKEQVLHQNILQTAFTGHFTCIDLYSFECINFNV